MPKPNDEVSQRIARMRQDNPLVAAASPPAIYANAPIKQPRVGKNGALHIRALAQGVRVNVMQLDRETFLVSSRPETEVRAIAASLPQAVVSPFASLSQSLRGRKFTLATDRKHTEYTGPVRISEVSDEDLINEADIERTRRKR